MRASRVIPRATIGSLLGDHDAVHEQGDHIEALQPRVPKTNEVIAEILVIAPRTVGKHLERIYTKLGVESRTAAAARAFEVFAA